MKQIFGLVPAGGVGARKGADRPKQYLRLGSRTLLEHALEGLLSDARVAQAYVVVAANDPYAAGLDLPARCHLLSCGGATRADTVRNGLRAALALQPAESWVLVHDAARPCLGPADLAALIDAGARDEHGGLLAVPIRDTVKHASRESAHESAQESAPGSAQETVHARVARTVDRDGLWRALTPQFFPAGVLLRALEEAVAAGEITDESSAVERLGLRPRLVAGTASNLKVTEPGDLALAESILRGLGRW